MPTHTLRPDESLPTETLLHVHSRTLSGHPRLDFRPSSESQEERAAWRKAHNLFPAYAPGHLVALPTSSLSALGLRRLFLHDAANHPVWLLLFLRTSTPALLETFLQRHALHVPPPPHPGPLVFPTATILGPVDLVTEKFFAIPFQEL